MVETLERVRVSVLREVPGRPIATNVPDFRLAGISKPTYEKITEYDADLIIATDSAFVLEVERTDQRIFPCERGDMLAINKGGELLRVLGMSLITHGVHRWQIIAERLEV